MQDFPHANVGGLSISRLIAGTNWFLGFSHTSVAKDKMIRGYMDQARIVEILSVFLERGVDAIMGQPEPVVDRAIKEAEQRTGRRMKRVYTPVFNLGPGGPAESEPEAVLDKCKEMGGDVCMPHTSVTDCLLDKLHREIRDIDRYTRMIRERDMIPGLSTHMPETVVVADETDADVETYIQMYNAAGFLMHVEADWAMKIIHQARKPVMTIKPLAAGRLLPIAGLSFVWSTIREQDMVTIGTMTPDEAREVVDLSLHFIERRLPEVELQKTRSKSTLHGGAIPQEY